MKNRWIKNKTLALGAGAFLLTAGISAGTAMAYFTTYTQVSGTVPLSLGEIETIPDEEVTDWEKRVTIENTGDMECFVRVRAFAGSQYQDGLVYSGENWSLAADGYYYYSEILSPGETSGELLIAIDNMESNQSFNVIVVQESAPVIYDGDGNPTGDWDHILDSGENVYDSSEEVGES
ncbi:MAG TPA: hypothetical protein H9738_06030 [Candidatus Blautia pullistercoris]|uniref:Alternate signal-mediated exported protein, CPF_0494 family n=1 Tax=Candidatus Blautia pullistercoris TaxID=2838499 RepID=A0A9D2ALZ3_9FIRM|nr:hypothetical protein [Candidatus Blautia pullistercoris]